MQPTPHPGFLVVIEGIDGAGKSTLQRNLAQWCRECGLAVITSREPTDGPHGKAIRQSAREGRLSLEAELDLFLKDRAEHATNLLRPALAKNQVVILDRYYFSNAAYQGARGLDPKKIIADNEAFAPVPNLVLLLDLDPATGRGRITQRNDTPDDFEGAEYLAQVREIFLSFDQPIIRRINAERLPELVEADCIVALSKALREHGILD